MRSIARPIADVVTNYRDVRDLTAENERLRAENERLNGIEAARRAGVEIPHYCWHPGLSVAGSCRMCLVEVGTRDPKSGKITMQPKLAPACNTWVLAANRRNAELCSTRARSRANSLRWADLPSSTTQRSWS